jgi:hypothetical protein
MGRAHNQRTNPNLSQDGNVVTPQMLQASCAHYTLFVTLRFSEGLGAGPTMIHKPRHDTIDIGWRWTEVPEGLTAEEAGPDVTVRLQFLEELGQNRIDFFLGPNCPDAALKYQICKDTLQLLLIDLEQKQMLLKEDP